MVIEVKRTIRSNKSTIGELFVNGAFECYTLEDCVREVADTPVVEWKVQNKTAIPVGTYDLEIDFSTRFQRLMPHLLNVPGFTGIRIHSGNTDKDTDGCILVGKEKIADCIWNSRLAFDPLFSKLQDAIASGDPVTVTIF